jgi:tRNA synthetases class I (W and Y)
MMQTWLRIPKLFQSEISARQFHRAPLFCNIQSFRSSSTQAPSKPPQRIIFSGVQPTGVPHLGNYLGAFRPWVRLQNNNPSKHQLNFSVVDLHALTVHQDPKQLSEWRWDTYVALLAVGLDPKRCRIFFQSEVSYDIAHLNIRNAHARRYDIIQN